MLKVGDTVKVIDKTHYSDGSQKEHIPIGTICTVKELDHGEDGITYYGILPVDERDIKVYFLYLENELEKGHMEWIKDE